MGGAAASAATGVELASAGGRVACGRLDFRACARFMSRATSSIAPRPAFFSSPILETNSVNDAKHVPSPQRPRRS
eukprot:576586-Prymnesium_polylepis.1